MKEATGELNMTVITIIMIGAILAFFWIMWGNIKGKINNQWEETSNSSERGYNYQKNDSNEVAISYQDNFYIMNW